MNFFVLVRAEVNQSGIDKPNNIEPFAKAALWQGYVILDGFVPVRKMNQTRDATPNRIRRLLQELCFLKACGLFLWCFFNCSWPSGTIDIARFWLIKVFDFGTRKKTYYQMSASESIMENRPLEENIKAPLGQSVIKNTQRLLVSILKKSWVSIKLLKFWIGQVELLWRKYRNITRLLKEVVFVLFAEGSKANIRVNCTKDIVPNVESAIYPQPQVEMSPANPPFL